MSDAFAHLSPEDRRRAEELADRFRERGGEGMEEWAVSEVEDGIPQLARYLFLRCVWRSGQQWKAPPDDWFAGREDEAAAAVTAEEDDPDVPTLVRSEHQADGAGDEDDDPPFLAARQAVRRILAAGADPEDLKEVARAVFLHTAFDVVHTVDEGYDPVAGEGMPGWLLAEVGSDLVTTGRAIPDLHEDLFTTEPDEA